MRSVAKVAAVGCSVGLVIQAARHERAGTIVFDLDGTLVHSVKQNNINQQSFWSPAGTLTYASLTGAAPNKATHDDYVVYTRPFVRLVIPLLAQHATLHISTRGTTRYANAALETTFGKEAAAQYFKSVVAREQQPRKEAKDLAAFRDGQARVLLVDDQRSNMDFVDAEHAQPGDALYHIPPFYFRLLCDVELLKFVVLWALVL